MKTLLSLFSIILVLSACNNNNGGGTAGKWSSADEQKFMNTCVQNATNAGADEQTAKAHCNCTLQKIEAKYSSYADADKNLTKEAVDAIEKDCNDNNNNAGGGNIGNNNNKGGGTAGKWSSADQQKFLNTCVQNATNAGADQQTAKAHCNCTLEKISAKYASYSDAEKNLTKNEIDAMEEDCNNNNNNTGGGFGNDNGGGFGNDNGGGNNNPDNGGGGLLGGLGGNDNNGGGMAAGTWATADQQKFMNTCIQNATKAGADRQTSNEHCKCVLQKIEAKYRTYADANTKMTAQEVNAIEQQCVQERGGGGGDN